MNNAKLCVFCESTGFICVATNATVGVRKAIVRTCFIPNLAWFRIVRVGVTLDLAGSFLPKGLGISSATLVV